VHRSTVERVYRNVPEANASFVLSRSLVPILKILGRVIPVCDPHLFTLGNLPGGIIPYGKIFS